MKKFFAQSFVLLTLLPIFSAGVLFLPREAQAASVTGVCEWTATNKTTKATRRVTLPGTLQTGCKDQDTPTETWVVKSFAPTGTQELSASIDGKEDSGSCINPLNWPTCFMSAIAATILQFASLFTTVTGYLLNGVVYHTVVNVSKNYGNLTAILTTWQALRDIANMCFIFVLLYAAIQTILGQKGNNQRLIVNVIVVAALLNFSLFFTRVVIDMGNALALTFYDAINPGVAATGFELGQAGISNAFMKHLNLSSLYNISNTVGGSGIIMTGIMGTIMLLVASFCFLAVAILFIIRYIVLILVMVFSPIAMIAYVLPSGTGVGAYQKQWMDALLGQTFFAPIYFLLTWVSLRVMGGFMTVLTDSTKAGDFEGTLSGIGVSQTLQSGAFMMFINFAVVIALLITSLVLASQWADKGGVGVSKWAKEKAGNMMGGATSWTGRKLVGQYGDRMANNAKLQEQALKGTGTSGAWARLKLYGAQKARSATFDPRNATIPTSVIGDAIRGTAGRTPLGKKMGLDDVRLTNLDFDAGRLLSKQLGAGEAEKGGYKEEQADKGKRLGAEKKAANDEYRQLQNEENILTGVTAAAIDAALRTPVEKRAVDAMEKAIATVSEKEIEAIVDSNRELLEKQEFANAISVKQLEAINKSDKFSDEEKDAIKKARFAPLESINDAAGLLALAVPAATRTAPQAAAAAKVERARKAAKGLSDSEIEMIKPELLQDDEFVGQLRQPQIDSLTKSSRFTTSTKDKIKEIRRKPLIDALNTGAGARVSTIIKKTDAKVLASYMNVDGRGGVKIAKDPWVIAAYTPQILKRMAAEMTPDDLTDLKSTIKTVLGPTHATSVWLDDTAQGKGVDLFG